MSKLRRVLFVFILIFILMHAVRFFSIVTSMGDEANLPSTWDNTVNFLLGFPMVLINERYPLRLGSLDYTTIEFTLISILNTVFQALLIIGLIYFVKKLKLKLKFK